MVKAACCYAVRTIKSFSEVMQMKSLVYGLAIRVAVGLLGWSASVPADEPGKQARVNPAKELAALQKDWSAAEEAFMKAYQEAKTNDEGKQILKEKRPKPAEFADRFLILAKNHPDTPQAMEALAWVVANARGTPAAQQALAKLKEKVAAVTDLDQLHKTLQALPPYSLGDLAPMVAEKVRKTPDHQQAVPLLVWVCSATAYGGTKDLAKLYNNTVDLLIDRFVERIELAPLAGWLARDDDPPWAEKHLRRLMAKNSSEAVKAEATFGLASILKNKDEASQAEAEKLLETISASKLPAYRHLAEQARKELDDSRVRGVGKPVPDIAGEDLDGKAFKLTDYKGKVVLLDFWGFW
jgi:hypothetical protein